MQKLTTKQLEKKLPLPLIELVTVFYRKVSFFGKVFLNFIYIEVFTSIVYSYRFNNRFIPLKEKANTINKIPKESENFHFPWGLVWIIQTPKNL